MLRARCWEQQSQMMYYQQCALNKSKYQCTRRNNPKQVFDTISRVSNRIPIHCRSAWDMESGLWEKKIWHSVEILICTVSWLSLAVITWMLWPKSYLKQKRMISRRWGTIAQPRRTLFRDDRGRTRRVIRDLAGSHEWAERSSRDKRWGTSKENLTQLIVHWDCPSSIRTLHWWYISVEYRIAKKF